MHLIETAKAPKLRVELHLPAPHVFGEGGVDLRRKAAALILKNAYGDHKDAI